MISKACTSTRLFFLNSGLAVASWAPMVPYAKMNLDLSESELGLVLLLMAIGALIMMPLSGFLVHHYGSRKLIPIASLLLIFTVPCLAIVTSVLGLGIALFMFGAILGILNVAVNSHAIAVEKQVQRPTMSSFHCLFSLGGLIGAGSMTFLLELGISLLSCTLLLSAFIAIVAITQSKYLIDCNSDPISQKKSSGFRLPAPIVLFLGLLCFISFLAEGAMLDWGALLLSSTHNYDISNAGMGYAFFAVAMALGRWGGDFIRNYFSDVLIIRAGGSIAAAGILIAVNVHWAHLELLGFFLVGIGASNIVPTLFSAAGRLNGVSASLALTTMTTMGYIGLLLGPAIIGFIAEAFSLPLALSGIAVLLIFIGICGHSAQADPASDYVA